MRKQVHVIATVAFYFMNRSTSTLLPPVLRPRGRSRKRAMAEGQSQKSHIWSTFVTVRAILTNICHPEVGDVCWTSVKRDSHLPQLATYTTLFLEVSIGLWGKVCYPSFHEDFPLWFSLEMLNTSPGLVRGPKVVTSNRPQWPFDPDCE